MLRRTPVRTVHPGGLVRSEFYSEASPPFLLAKGRGGGALSFFQSIYLPLHLSYSALHISTTPLSIQLYEKQGLCFESPPWGDLGGRALLLKLQI
jgi:hypothetical protein